MFIELSRYSFSFTIWFSSNIYLPFFGMREPASPRVDAGSLIEHARSGTLGRALGRAHSLIGDPPRNHDATCLDFLDGPRTEFAAVIDELCGLANQVPDRVYLVGGDADL